MVLHVFPLSLLLVSPKVIGHMLEADQYLLILFYFSGEHLYMVCMWVRWCLQVRGQLFERVLCFHPVLWDWTSLASTSFIQLVYELLDDSPVCCPSPYWSTGIVDAHHSIWVFLEFQSLNSGHQTSLAIPFSHWTIPCFTFYLFMFKILLR